MTQLEDLKFAHKMTTQGEWDTIRHGTPDYAPQYGVYAGDSPRDLAIVFREADGDFMCMAHAITPTLIEAVELLEDVSVARARQDHEFDVDAWYIKVRALLEKLNDQT